MRRRTRTTIISIEAADPEITAYRKLKKESDG